MLFARSGPHAAREQAEMGEKVASEDGLVTSHPHPHLLSLGPVSDLLTRVVGRWDRARDRTGVNRQHPEDEGKRHVTRMAETWGGMRGDPGSTRPDDEPEPQDHRMGGA